MRVSPILFAIVLVTLPGIALAQSATQITILTNKQSYVTGDTISISGTISSLGASNSAVLQVYNTFNVLIQIETINVASDGTFHTTVKAEGQSWENDGLYEIKVLYISTPILATATANVNFKANSVQSTPAPSATVTQPTLPAPPSSQTQPAAQPNIQNTTIISDNQTPIEEQIKQRIALANKLKQQLDQSTTTEIPFWVKDNARKWHDGMVDNAAFSKDIQYFISSGLVRVSGQVTPTSTFEHIPSWQKDVAGWWSQGTVSDYDYVNSIQFLLDKKIIK